jgi:Holliday junction resolvasome RuvABC DNA-binding subunit
MVNQNLKRMILEVLDKQIKNNNPKCTRQTLNRLVDLGYSNKEAREMIGSVLGEELFEILKEQKPFNEYKYAEKLKRLGAK